ncbi:hypothetical protein PHLGIDRAFT_121500 [Phlebiopsis gigantea 11061_1 CR5-6]|uniref:Uncharacterized protein n=1 Tax=Phlebiopsis gigantea (strain 11061_1 CR5-6) TaxID=745531 RepID=A0A0C3NFN4_PHLG1|nr:hypothetical protein PHLGIDRAFT_121500 [Phlebiopsis gigantea 11061_1 CR5-6]
MSEPTLYITRATKSTATRRKRRINTLVDSDGYAADDDVGDDLNYEDDSGSDSNTHPFDSLFATQEQRDQQFAQLAFVNAVDRRLRALQAMTGGERRIRRETDSEIFTVAGSGSTQPTVNITEAVPPTPANRAPEHVRRGDAESSATRTEGDSPSLGTKRKRDDDADLPSSKQRRL